jgi:hypothetical protein
MDDRTVRAALERHWDASDASDFKAKPEIYREAADRRSHRSVRYAII